MLCDGFDAMFDHESKSTHAEHICYRSSAPVLDSNLMRAESEAAIGLKVCAWLLSLCSRLPHMNSRSTRPLDKSINLAKNFLRL